MSTIGRDAVEITVAAHWNSVLGTPPSSLDESFFSCGGNSLHVARLASLLRRATGRPIPLDVLFEGPTVRHIATWLKSNQERPLGRLVPLRPAGKGMPLVMLPSGGGGLTGLTAFGGPRFQRPVHAIQSRGFAPEEVPAKSMQELIKDFADVLEASELDRTVHLGGFCIGGLFAYELAKFLRPRGWEIASVALINTTLHNPPISRHAARAARLAALAQMADLPLGPDALPTVEELFERLRASGMDLVERSTADFSARLEVTAATAEAVGAYRFTPPDNPLRMVLYSSPERVNLDDQEALRGEVIDWTELGLPGLEVVPIPGVHLDILSDESTLDAIERRLAACEAFA